MHQLEDTQEDSQNEVSNAVFEHLVKVRAGRSKIAASNGIWEHARYYLKTTPVCHFFSGHFFNIELSGKISTSPSSGLSSVVY